MSEEHFGQEIAVIGMAGRFPGAADIATFWDNLQAGRESITTFDDDALRAAGVPESFLSNPAYVKCGAVINDIQMFDADFFGFTTLNARLMDPQHRLFLEMSWAALENAGHDPETFDGSIGIFGGAGISTYLPLVLGDHELALEGGDYQILLGNDKDHLTTRVSYKLNLKGPSINVQSACSTSLVATHLACQSLIDYQCDMALAGGVTVGASPVSGYLFQEGGIRSPDGHCRAFDAESRGCIGGNGVGLVVLRRLEDALEDRDNILAVIKGSAINNDGADKAGYTAPSVNGQAEVIAAAFEIAEVDPRDISYVEAHGTGTQLGDPVEVTALNRVFNPATDDRQFCALGAVKSNIGHLDTAAGVAGLIKTVLSLYHGKIPPSLHYTKPNPQIDFANSAFYVNTQLRDYPQTDGPRRAAVSSFGVGGTNAHVILEQPPQPQATEDGRGAQLILLSARTPSALSRAMVNLRDALEADPALDIADVAYTLQMGRRAFSQRSFLVTDSLADAVVKLDPRTGRRAVGAVVESGDPGVVFMFPGQGAQYVDMGRELYEGEPLFRQEVDQVLDLFNQHMKEDLKRLIFAEGVVNNAGEFDLARTDRAQPALFVIEYAMAKLLMHWGVQPQAMIGHSIGEYVAACLAGIFTLEEAVRLVTLRGKLMQEMPEGDMLAVPMPESWVTSHLGDNLSLAAVNGPEMCIVSGSTIAVEALNDQLKRERKNGRILHTSHAYHSHLMEGMLPAFQAELKKLNPGEPTIPIVSTLTGDWMTREESADPLYWSRQLRGTVRFHAAVKSLAETPDLVLVEVGPGKALSGFAKQVSDQVVDIFPSMRHPKENIPDLDQLLHTLGKLWLHGIDIDWNAFYGDQKCRRVPLPGYPFERKPYWVKQNGPLSVPQTTGAPTSNSEPADDSTPATAEDEPLNIPSHIFAPVWERTASLKAPEEFLTEEGNWLIFSDTTGLGFLLKGQLEKYNQHVTMVREGASMSLLFRNLYASNARSPEDFRALMASLAENEVLPNYIFYMWDMDSSPAAGEVLSDKGLTGLFLLLQALNETSDRKVELFVVTNQLQKVTDEDTVLPGKAPIMGLCRAIDTLIKGVDCKMIDVGATTPAQLKDKWLVDQVLQEALLPTTSWSVAFRKNHRWSCGLENPAAIKESKAPALPTCLIAGRPSPLDLAMLAAAQGEDTRRWLLIPAPEHGPLETQPLSTAGGEVITLDAGLDDVDQMRQTLQAHHPVHGVFYFTGTPDLPLDQGDKMLEALRIEATRFQNTATVVGELRPLRAVCFTSLKADLDTSAAALSDFTDAYIQTGGAHWRHVRLDLEQEPGMDHWSLNPQTAGRVLNSALAAEGPNVSQLLIGSPDLDELIVEQYFEGGQYWDNASAATARPNLATTYSPPRNDTEKLICEVLESQLGIEKVGIHDDFFDLGGNSLTAVLIASRLEGPLKLTIDPSLLVENPTAAMMAATVEALKETPLGVLKSSPIVPIQPRGDNPPFFLVHPAGGNVFAYRELAHALGDEQPIFGMRAFDLDEVQDHLLRMTDLAAHYVKCLLEFQREGPYLLGGWSFGGFVAFEMARQLVQREKEVALLAIFDTPGPDPVVGQLGDVEEVDLLMALGREWARQNRKRALVMSQKIKRLESDQQLEYLLDYLKKKRALSPDKDLVWIRKLAAGYRSRIKSVSRYRAGVYPGKIVLFRAKDVDKESIEMMPEKMREMIQAPDFGWGPYSSQPIDIYTVSGYHETILVGSNAKAVGKILRPYIKEINKGQDT